MRIKKFKCKGLKYDLSEKHHKQAFVTELTKTKPVWLMVSEMLVICGLEEKVKYRPVNTIKAHERDIIVQYLRKKKINCDWLQGKCLNDIKKKDIMQIYKNFI